MIKAYLTDTIDIINRTYDNYGAVSSEDTQSGIKARIEDKNRIVRDINGNEVASSVFILIDKSATLKYESKIKLKTQNGIALEEANRERAILQLGKGHGFEMGFWRVWL